MASMRRATLAVALGAGLLVVGCDLGPTHLNASTPAASDPPLVQPIVVPYRQPQTDEFCRDRTGSYPEPYSVQADHVVADWLDRMVRPNQGGVVAYVTLIDSHSYRADSTVLTIVVPPLPPDPSAPALQSMPKPTGDPFTDPLRRAAVQTENAARLRSYQQQLVHAHARVDRDRQQVHAETNALRTLDPPTDSLSTSIWGCLATASARFTGTSGDKWLILASDTQNNTLADFAPDVSLRGVHVAVIDFYATTAPESEATIRYWTTELRARGAVDVHFYDPAATQVLPNLLDSTGGHP